MRSFAISALLGVHDPATRRRLSANGLDLREPVFGQTLVLVALTGTLLFTGADRATNGDRHQPLLQTVENDLGTVEVGVERLCPVLAASGRDPSVHHRCFDGVLDALALPLALVLGCERSASLELLEGRAIHGDGLGGRIASNLDFTLALALTISFATLF